MPRSVIKGLRLLSFLFGMGLATLAVTAPFMTYVPYATQEVMRQDVWRDCSLYAMGSICFFGLMFWLGKGDSKK